MKAKERHIKPEELSTYLDQELKTQRQEEVARHLKACEACREVADELGMLRNGLSSLADVEPERDLWLNVRPALRSFRDEEEDSWWRRFWMVPVAAAFGAAAVLAIVLILGGIALRDDGSPAGPIQALDAVAKAEIEYRHAIDSLGQTLVKGKTNMSPETREIVAHGLAEIDQTIEKYRAELGRNPNDMETREFMLAVYQQKVDFMTELVAETLAE